MTTVPVFPQPSHLQRVTKYEECVALHLRLLELTSNFKSSRSVPRVTIPSSLQSQCNHYLLALSERRSGKLNAIVNRNGTAHSLTDLGRCYNSF